MAGGLLGIDCELKSKGHNCRGLGQTFWLKAAVVPYFLPTMTGVGSSWAVAGTLSWSCLIVQGGHLLAPSTAVIESGRRCYYNLWSISTGKALYHWTLPLPLKKGVQIAGSCHTGPHVLVFPHIQWACPHGECSGVVSLLLLIYCMYQQQLRGSKLLRPLPMVSFVLDSSQAARSNHANAVFTTGMPKLIPPKDISKTLFFECLTRCCIIANLTVEP